MAASPDVAGVVFGAQGLLMPSGYDNPHCLALRMACERRVLSTLYLRYTVIPREAFGQADWNSSDGETVIRGLLATIGVTEDDEVAWAIRVKNKIYAELVKEGLPIAAGAPKLW